MGVVYLAEDTRLARLVTLKVLHPHDTADEKRRERLRIEARAAAALVHPNVAAWVIEPATTEAAFPDVASRRA